MVKIGDIYLTMIVAELLTILEICGFPFKYNPETKRFHYLSTKRFVKFREVYAVFIFNIWLSTEHLTPWLSSNIGELIRDLEGSTLIIWIIVSYILYRVWRKQF